MNITWNQVRKCKQALQIATWELAIKETPGRKATPRIVEYLKTTTLDTEDANTDETPWCSAFVCWVIERAGMVPTRSAMARSWLKWGIATTTPIPGAIAVFRRGQAPAGHVAIVVAVYDDDIEVVGGNQGDAVTKARYKKATLLGYRLPAPE